MLPELIVLFPNGDFNTLIGFPTSREVDYKGAYIYRKNRNYWYTSWYFDGIAWLPVNDDDVPKAYISRIKTIQLLL